MSKLWTGINESGSARETMFRNQINREIARERREVEVELELIWPPARSRWYIKGIEAIIIAELAVTCRLRNQCYRMSSSEKVIKFIKTLLFELFCFLLYNIIPLLYFSYNSVAFTSLLFLLLFLVSSLFFFLLSLFFLFQFLFPFVFTIITLNGLLSFPSSLSSSPSYHISILPSPAFSP